MVGRRQDDPVGSLGQLGQAAFRLLVGQGTVQKIELEACLVEVGAKRRGAGGVVGRVEEEAAGSGFDFDLDPLQAAWPAHRLQPLPGRLGVEFSLVECAELLCRAQREGEVGQLVAAGEWRPEGVPGIRCGQRELRRGFGLTIERDLGGCVDQSGAADRGAAVEFAFDFRRRTPGQALAAGSHHAGFLARNRRQGPAELLRVVAGDLGDHTEHGVRDVRRVETAAQADLEDGRVDLVCREVEPGRGGETLEVGRRRRSGGSERASEVGSEFGLGDRLAVDAEALLDVLEVGGGVEAAAVTGGGQERRQRRARRALAVRARDQDRGYSPLGIAEGAEEVADRVEAELLAPDLEPVEDLLGRRSGLAGHVAAQHSAARFPQTATLGTSCPVTASGARSSTRRRRRTPNAARSSHASSRRLS